MNIRIVVAIEERDGESIVSVCLEDSPVLKIYKTIASDKFESQEAFCRHLQNYISNGIDHVFDELKKQ